MAKGLFNTSTAATTDEGIYADSDSYREEKAAIVGCRLYIFAFIYPYFCQAPLLVLLRI